MTGTCKLCREIITGAPVFEVGDGRALAEFATFSEAMRKHVFTRHQQQLQTFASLLTMAASFFSSLFADCATEDFDAAQESTRAILCSAFQSAQLVVDAGAAVQTPLVVPS